MGSIELFPRTQPRRAAIDAWRATPIAGSGTVRVREARLADYAAVRALQKRAGSVLPCTVRQYEGRLHRFPAGQLVALRDGEIVGLAACLMLDWDVGDAQPTWASLTGDGFFTTHDADGRSLYGAEMTLDPTQRGFGAAHALVQARRKLCRRLNLRRIVATPPLAGLPEDGTTPEQYAMRIAWGDALEPTWRFLTARGFQFCAVLRDFMPAQAGGCGHAGLLAWLNPLYAPPGPPASEERETRRQCA